MEALLLDKARNPSVCLVQLDEASLDVSHLDEPAVESSVDERSLTTPAEGITMSNCTGTEESALVLQVFLDDLVGILDVDTLVRCN